MRTLLLKLISIFKEFPWIRLTDNPIGNKIKLYVRLYLPGFVSFYREFPRPVRFVFLFFIIVIMLLLSLSLYQISQLGFGGEKTNQEVSQKILKNRQGPLHGIGGEITSIEDSRITINSDIRKTYYATVNDETSISSVKRKLTKKEVKTTYEDKTVNDLKVGTRIYLQSKKDLLEENNLSPEDIKSIEIYAE